MDGGSSAGLFFTFGDDPLEDVCLAPSPHSVATTGDQATGSKFGKASGM